MFILISLILIYNLNIDNEEKNLRIELLQKQKKIYESQIEKIVRNEENKDYYDRLLKKIEQINHEIQKLNEN